VLRIPPLIFDERVVLRPLAEEHVPVVERALADLEIQRWFDDRGLTARDVVERAAARWAATEAAEFAIIDEAECVGSIWVAERVGFTREGLLRSWADVNGERVDQVSFSLLPSDLTATSASESRGVERGLEPRRSRS
jgi:hypothetical protein